MARRVQIVGGTGSGMTSLVNLCTLGSLAPTIPTHGFNTEKISHKPGGAEHKVEIGGTVTGSDAVTRTGIGATALQLWDLGTLPDGWGFHMALPAAVLVFMVDASDRSKFDEAVRRLASLELPQLHPQPRCCGLRAPKPASLTGPAILVLANKSDVAGAASASDVAAALPLAGLAAKGYDTHCIATSLTARTGVTDALDWMVLQANRR